MREDGSEARTSSSNRRCKGTHVEREGEKDEDEEERKGKEEEQVTTI